QRLLASDAPRRVCGKLTTPGRNHVTPANLAVIGPWFAPPVRVGHLGGVRNVSSINSIWRAGSGAHRFCCRPRKVSSSGMPVALRWLAAALPAAARAACAQQPPVMTSSRPAVQEGARKTVARHRAPSVVARYHAQPASEKLTAGTKGAGYGLASFYSYDP